MAAAPEAAWSRVSIRVPQSAGLPAVGSTCMRMRTRAAPVGMMACAVEERYRGARMDAHARMHACTHMHSLHCSIQAITESVVGGGGGTGGSVDPPKGLEGPEQRGQ